VSQLQEKIKTIEHRVMSDMTKGFENIRAHDKGNLIDQDHP
jgi:hypothetical protein